ncbi:MAG: hypothetical protein ABI832_22635 [bacterium]
MNDHEAFSHVALTADLYRSLHAYLENRPAAETGRVLLALEGSPACNINATPPVEAVAEAAAAPPAA